MSGKKDNEYFDISEVEYKCPIYMKYKKASLKTMVGFFLLKDLNDLVKMDPKKAHGRKILLMIDHTTQFSTAAATVKSKCNKDIVWAILQQWVALFGAPSQILSDNGEEFNNKLLREMSDHRYIFIRSKSRKSPRSNGVTERHNTKLRNMISKFMLDNSIVRQICNKKL